MMRGKLEPEKLKNLVLPYLGAANPKICVPPRLGEDAAVIDLGCTYLVLASDPITGAIDNIGMYSINVNANDVACMGAIPQFFLSVMLLPEMYTDEHIRKIASDISEEARALNVSIVGGHTEALPLDDPIVVGTMAGTTDTIVTSAGAHLGDDILLTKGAAIEGTSILATDFYDILREKVDVSLLRRAQKYLTRISVVREALPLPCTIPRKEELPGLCTNWLMLPRLGSLWTWIRFQCPRRPGPSVLHSLWIH
jgi:hydrogenase maturation factor